MFEMKQLFHFPHLAVVFQLLYVIEFGITLMLAITFAYLRNL